MRMENNQMTSPAQDPLLRLADDERREMLRLLEVGELPHEVDRQDDRFFKYLLGRPARSPLLMDLLNSIFVPLGYPRVASLTIENAELPPETRDVKLSRLDIRATDEHGRKQIIELQKRKHSSFAERELLYWAKDYGGQLVIGAKYSDLKPTVSISLTGFKLFAQERQAVWDFVLMNPRTGKVLTRHEVLVFVELPKFGPALETLQQKTRAGQSLTEEDRLVAWGGYFSDTKMGVEIVREIAAKDPVFQEVRRTEEDYWQTPEARYFLLRQQLAEMDRMAEMDDAIAEAEARIAKNLLASGMPPELIAQNTGLSVEQVRALGA
jgi:predicted transposase/invertase (TIGR01784 family)